VEALALLVGFPEANGHMAAVPGLVRSLLAVVTTKTQGRPEIPRLAGRILSIQAASVEGVRGELEVLKEHIIHHAFGHPIMAELCWAVFLLVPLEQPMPLDDPTELATSATGAGGGGPWGWGVLHNQIIAKI